MNQNVKNETKSIFNNKNFMLLLIGQIVSNIGNAVHSVAVTWYIISLVNEEFSGRYLAGFMMCMFIPMIVFGPITGVYVDKLDRKKLIVGTDFLRGILLLLLAIVTISTNDEITKIISLFAITFTSTIIGTFFNPAVQASIPNVVDEENLMKANSINGITMRLTFIIGTAIGGILYALVGIIGIFIINGISFILSGVSEMFIKLEYIKKEKTESSVLKDFIDGIKYLKGHKVIIILLGFSLFYNFLFSPMFAIVFPKVVKFTLGLGSSEFGFFEAVFSIGALVGMLIVPLFSKMKSYFKLMTIGIIGQSLAFAMIGVPILPKIMGFTSKYTVFITLCIIVFIMMAINSLVNVPVITVFQKRIDDEYRGRFFGILGTLNQGIVPIGLAVIGYISDIVIPSTLFFISGGLSVLIGISMFFVKELREI